MNITVIGSGYVSLVSGTCFAEMGNNKTESLQDFIKTIEEAIKNINLRIHPTQAGDVKRTSANIDLLLMDYVYKPNISIKEGFKENYGMV